MTFLRLLGMLWLFYVTARIVRSFRDSVGGPPGAGPTGSAGRRGSPFDAYGPFGRFGPFGPFGPRGPGGAGGQAPPDNAGWYGPFSASDPFGDAARPGARQEPRQDPRQNWTPPRSPQPAAAKSPYEVLGIRPGASMQEVRKAYQELVRQYHPDRLDGLGAELRVLAEQRTKEITAAYNQLKRRS